MGGRTVRFSMVAAFALYCACDQDVQDSRSLGTSQRAGDSTSCESLGYDGTCISDVSLWHQDGVCHVRDCGSEGKTCGFISSAAGYGCLEGTQGASTFDCLEVGYDGACLSNDVLVWSEDESCRWADCAAFGLGCGWTDAVGYDCTDGNSEPDPPQSGGLLTVGEIVGGYDYGVSQDYGPTTFDGGYSYCHGYGSWGGQLVHCGVDVTIPYGTPMYIPGDGTVLISGESPYYEDVYNPAAGELKIQLNHDGAHVILGHMTSIDVWTGQTVKAGQAAGLSGTMNGPHVHIEVRVPDPSFASGLRTVDPMLYFGW